MVTVALLQPGVQCGVAGGRHTEGRGYGSTAGPCPRGLLLNKAWASPGSTAHLGAPGDLRSSGTATFIGCSWFSTEGGSGPPIRTR